MHESLAKCLSLCPYIQGAKNGSIHLLFTQGILLDSASRMYLFKFNKIRCFTSFDIHIFTEMSKTSDSEDAITPENICNNVLQYVSSPQRGSCTIYDFNATVW